jgi:RNA polymerase sigma-70 factor (ECF subfamily)
VTPQEQLAETVRVEGRRVLATLIRVLGDMQLAEDAVQEAAVAALRTWPRSGMLDEPRRHLCPTWPRRCWR